MNSLSLLFLFGHIKITGKKFDEMELKSFDDYKKMIFHVVKYLPSKVDLGGHQGHTVKIFTVYPYPY